MHIDTSCVRGHDVQVDKLFKLVDVTDQVEAYTDIEDRFSQSVKRCKTMLSLSLPGCHSRDCGKNCKRKPTSVYNIMGDRAVRTIRKDFGLLRHCGPERENTTAKVGYERCVRAP